MSMHGTNTREGKGLMSRLVLMLTRADKHGPELRTVQAAAVFSGAMPAAVTHIVLRDRTLAAEIAVQPRQDSGAVQHK